MATVRVSMVWALTLAIHAATAGVSATSAFDGDQAVVVKPIDPSVVQPPQETESVRPLPPGVYRAGMDVSMPQIVSQVLPRYTPHAMRDEIQGVVRLDGIVGVDGIIRDVRVVRSLDAVYGLDEEAVKATRQWTFEAGKKDGVPVPVLITIEATFSMSPSVHSGKSRR